MKLTSKMVTLASAIALLTGCDAASMSTVMAGLDTLKQDAVLNAASAKGQTNQQQPGSNIALPPQAGWQDTGRQGGNQPEQGPQSQAPDQTGLRQSYDPNGLQGGADLNGGPAPYQPDSEQQGPAQPNNQPVWNAPDQMGGKLPGKFVPRPQPKQ